MGAHRAHIDHSGALPILVKGGYDGPVLATAATRDLCAAMLADAAMIQDSDARYINKQIDRGQVDMDPVEPLYDQDDVVRSTVACFVRTRCFDRVTVPAAPMNSSCMPSTIACATFAA